MATTTPAAKSFHIRSTSFPSKSHPNLVQVQDCLHLVNAWEASPSKKAQLVSGLGHLKDLYSSINAFLQFPLTQKALFAKQNLVRELMDDFLCLLDVCAMVEDSLLQMREQYQSLGSLIRRGDSGLESGLSAYHCARKRMKKEMSKCRRLLKCMEKHVVSSNNEDTVDQVFKDARTSALSIFSVFSWTISGQKAEKSIFSRLRLLGSKIHEEEGDQNDMSDIEKADMAIFTLCSNSSKMNAQRQLEASDLSLSELELELEDVFRCLIQTKVSLLNIVTSC